MLKKGIKILVVYTLVLRNIDKGSPLKAY